MADNAPKKVDRREEKDAGGGATVQPPPEGVGIQDQQVPRTSERKEADVKADLTSPEDIELGVLQEPEHEADKSPYPVQEQPPIERPPFATGRPDVPIVQSAVTGAGEHTPPDPEEFDAQGRPRNVDAQGR